MVLTERVLRANFGLPDAPEVILEASREHLLYRLNLLEQRYQSIFSECGLDSFYSSNFSNLQLFSLIQSPLEYLLHVLSEKEPLDLNTFEQDLIKERIRVESNLAAARKLEDDFRIYETNQKPACLDIYADPNVFSRLERTEANEKYWQLVEQSSEYIKQWSPQVWEEIQLFIPSFILPWSHTDLTDNESKDMQPGYVFIDPWKIERLEYEREDPILSILMASLIVHESRHQKAFFFYRMTENELMHGDRPCGFIKLDHRKDNLLSMFQRYTLEDLFDVLLSVVYDHRFLKFALDSLPVGKYREAIQKRVDRKYEYLLTLLMSGEQNSSSFTQMGKEAWAQVNAFLADA